MDDLNEIYAACIIEYVRRDENKVKSGPFYFIGKEARDAFNLPYSEKIFNAAIDILEDIGVLTRYNRKGMQTYYRVDAGKFDSVMAQDALELRKYTITRGTHDGEIYPFLEAFADIGPDYLREALEAYEPQLDAIGDEQEDDDEEVVPVESSSWTGLPSDFVLSEERQRELVRVLDTAEERLATLDVSQEVKAQARAYIISARILAEAPEPPVELIWNIIGRANSLAGIASLFVSIITLFSTAVH